MEIKIITTKRKLTKSIVNQMPFRVFNDFDSFEIIGLLRNIRNKIPTVILCKHSDKGYFLTNTNFWIFDDGRHSNEVWFNGRAIVSFANNIERNTWWGKYQNAKSNTIQLYI